MCFLFGVSIRDKIQTFLKSNEDEVVLPRCNAFLRRLIYQTVQEKLKDQVSLETRTVNRDKLLVATKPKTREQRENDEQKRIETELKDLDDAVGFSKVLRLLINSVSFCF